MSTFTGPSITTRNLVLNFDPSNFSLLRCRSEFLRILFGGV